MQALMIYSHHVATDFVKHKSREKDLEVYTLNELTENIAYIIDDICPEVILISEDILALSGDLFQASLKECTHKAKVILLTDQNKIDNSFDLIYQIPFDPSSLINEILNLGEIDG